MEEELKKMVEELTNFEQLKYEKIPDIDLYMDQVTKFVEEKLHYLKRNDKDDALTKTMINNYTKAGLLIPPVKKRYSRDNMVLIVLTYYLKQILSINDIQALLSPIVEKIKAGEEYSREIEKIYSTFIKIEEKEYSDFEKNHNFHSFFSQENETEEKRYYELLSTVVGLIVKATIQKRMAEKIIDDFFSKKAF
jgi:hypothetical protein